MKPEVVGIRLLPLSGMVKGVTLLLRHLLLVVAMIVQHLLQYL